MINPGRKIVADSLAKVIEYLFGRNDISEKTIKDAWIEEISGSAKLTYNGWYEPPENGMAVLASKGDDMGRTHFKSFRDPQFFASPDPINWSNSAIIAYASNVDVETGLPADFATTMYFGERTEVKDHFRHSIMACHELFSELKDVAIGKELYLRMSNILSRHGIDGRTWSTTDNDYNFGHTLPFLALGSGLRPTSSGGHTVVTSTGAEDMRNVRMFLSEKSEVDLTSGIQFTVEPQCVSQQNRSLPKVMIHYVVQFLDGDFRISDACDHLPSEYGLR